MATAEMKCAKHHTPTQLSCAQCGTPACTKCLVWTEVGQKCFTCVPHRRRSRRGPLVPIAIGAVVVLALFKAGGTFSSSPSRVATPPVHRVEPGIGEPVRDGAITFVVNKLDCGTKEIGEDPIRRTALGHYCVLAFTAKNTANQPASFSPSVQLLLDRQRRRFAFDPQATIIYQRTMSTDGAATTGIGFRQMNPGAQLSAALVYDIPDGVAPEVAEMHASNSLGVTIRLSGAAAPPG